MAPEGESARPTVAAPQLPAADALALLQRWTEAQRSGDFAAYEQLYASKFLGIKRAGARATRFAREAWMRDRRRMFQKPIELEVSDAEVRSAAESAEVSFIQRWASGTFRDVGPKKLLVVREGGALRIAHEEMLHSAAQAVARAAPDLHFTLALGSGLYLVLPEAPLPEAHGEITRDEELGGERDDPLFTHVAELDEAQLAPELRSWTTRRVRLDDGCVAQVDGFVLLSRVEPHFGTVQAWRGTGDTPGPPLAASTVAQQAFALARPQVAARLAGCTRGLFAQPVDTSAPVEGTQIADESLLARARAAFTRLPSVRRLQQRHLREAEDPRGVWWASSLRAQAFRHPRSGQVLVSVQADNGGVCASFAASEWAIFEQRGNGLVRSRSGLSPANIVRALDVDADGRLELLVEHPDLSTDRALISPDEAWPEPKLTRSYQDCPC